MFGFFRITSAAAATCFLLAACGGSGGAVPDSPQPFIPPNETSAVPIPPGQIEAAIARLDELASGLLARSRVPGMSVAVVHNGRTIYVRGFGVREAGKPDKVDADTVFQLASVSKPVGATVVAQQVGAGAIAWDTPLRAKLPWFTLADPYVGEQVTIGDMYAHRSGLPDHAGDKLEDLGYGRVEVLQRLRMVPLSPFRATYNYTNFGLTAAAETVAAAAGTDWATLSERALYRPLGMTSTSSRYADYKARANRAITHIRVNEEYVPGPAREPDAQSPAGGMSSNANDMSRWLAMLLGSGSFNGQPIVDPAALQPAISPQMISAPPENANARAGFYGYGFNVGTSASGRVTLSHSGAFALGAATAFTAIPSANVGIVVLTNATPVGVPEALAAYFIDLVQFGSIQYDWETLYRQRMASLIAPEGSLVGVQRPANPAPAQPLANYAGIYRNDYYGPLNVVDNGGKLELRLGPKPTVYPLTHWDGDIFTFTPENENAPPGTISKATFSTGKLVLEYYDDNGLGTFAR